MESILGDTSRWYQHLLGAYEVIRSSNEKHAPGEAQNMKPAIFLSTPDERWLLRNFAYHDVMMSVTCQRRPLLPGNYWELQGESVIDPYFGLASRLIHLLSDVSSLRADMADEFYLRESSALQDDLLDPNGCMESQPSASFSNRSQELESQLLGWQCASSKDACLVCLAELYRGGALIHLYRTLRTHVFRMRETLNIKIKHVVENMVECLETLPAGSLPECTLLFPLFMAGGEADSDDHRAVIRQRMLDIHASRGFQNVKMAMDVLDELWTLRGVSNETGGVRSVDWQDILRGRDWKLALT